MVQTQFSRFVKIHTISSNQGRKCRDSVSKGIDMIFHREILVRRYFGINIEKSVIFSDISYGQHGSTKVKHTTVKSMCYSAAPYFAFLG